MTGSRAGIQLADHKTAEVFHPALKVMYRVLGGDAVSRQTKACREGGMPDR